MQSLQSYLCCRFFRKVHFPLEDVKGFMFQKELEKAQKNLLDNETDSEFLFDFPSSILYGHEFFLGINMFGVRTAGIYFLFYS